MRLIVCGSVLILCCAFIQTLAESKNHKRSRDTEDGSLERPTTYKADERYKSKYESGDGSEEDYKTNRHHNRKAKEDHDFPREKKHLKYTKRANRYEDSEEEPQSFKKDQKFYGAKDKGAQESAKRFGKTKSTIIEEDSDEESNENFTETKKIHHKEDRQKLWKRQLEEDASSERNTKAKKYPNKRREDIKDDDSEESEEETAKFEQKLVKKTIDDSEEESEEEVPKKTFRRKIRVRIPDSSEDDSDEDDYERGACRGKSKKGKGSKSCLDEESANGHGERDEPGRPKKIKYSIKFAHEKEKSTPTEDNNIVLKIHRGDKKKYKYQNDDDDDSSEENTFPKRIHFGDDDEE